MDDGDQGTEREPPGLDFVDLARRLGIPEETDELLRLEPIEVHLLALLFRRYPEWLRRDELIPAELDATRRTEREAALERLSRDRLIGPATAFMPIGDLITITDRGIRAFLRHFGFATSTEVSRMVRPIVEAIGTLGRMERSMRERLEAEARSRGEATRQVTRQVDEANRRIVDVERRFFGQILTVSAVLVAAFALIVTGGQTIQEQNRAVGVDATSLFFRSMAVMTPVAGAVFLLIAAAWVFSWSRPEHLYDARIHAPEIRPRPVDDPDQPDRPE